MKKLINRPEAVVDEMIAGLVASHPGLARIRGRNVIARFEFVNSKSGRVALISGGGSGHEPAHAGYVGHGMLSAAVAGAVFTSPGPDSIYDAIRAVAGPSGVLLIVKNYTGDRLNFGLAAERARSDGIPVEIALIGDDVALAATSDAGKVGRRGLAGTVLVHKVAGALAESGATLAEVAAAARAVAANLGTIGVALSPCTVPAAGKPGFTLGEDEVELGLGIHGEPGVRKGRIEPADTLVDTMVERLAVDLVLQPGQRIVLLVNNLGATPTMELAIVARRAIENLEARRLVVERVYVGTFLSALEMAGISLSVLRVDDSRLALLDAPTSAPAWPNAASSARTRNSNEVVLPPTQLELESASATRSRPQTESGKLLEAALRRVLNAVHDAADRLNELDQHVGDGDIGVSLARGADAVAARLDFLPLDDPAATLRALGPMLQDAIGGSSGAFYAVGLLRAASSLKSSTSLTLRDWATALETACRAISDLGGAEAGDRTMLDALMPASKALRAALDASKPGAIALQEATAAARLGTEATKSMHPSRGRSTYLGDRVLGHPDPGAEAVAVWLAALSA